MTFVDTNVILRWLLGDHQDLSFKAEKIVESAQPKSLLITDVVVAEIVYVLRSTGRNRSQTAEALSLLTRTNAFYFEKEELIHELITLIATTSLDFADCYLLARSIRERAKLLTFDNQLNKLAKR